MSVKKWLFSIVLMGLLSRSLIWASEYKVETLFNQEFEAAIKNVVLGEYIEDNIVKFYPKIIYLVQYDSIQNVTGSREIRILNHNGNVIKQIAWHAANWDVVGHSRKGNYFYVYSARATEGRDEKERVLVGTFKVYNGNGDMVYEVDNLTQEYETGFEFYLSSKDGSALIKKTINPYAGVSDIEQYDKSGQKLRSDLTEREKYSKKLDIADNGENIVSLAEYPEEFPSQNRIPTVLFLDSLGNILWQRKLKERKLSGEGGFDYISANGSYIYASGYDLGDSVVRNGYIFNKTGASVMEVLGGCEPLCFSADERYLLIRRAKKYRLGISKDEGAKIYGIALIDIIDKQILFEKDHQTTGIPAWNGGGAISNDKNVSFVKVGVGVNKGLGNRIFTMDCCVSVLDREGNRLWESEPFYSDYAKVIGDNMRWHNSNLIYLLIDQTKQVLQLKSVQFVDERKEHK